MIVSERLVLKPATRGDYAEWSNLRLASRDHLEQWEPVWPQDANSKADWTRRLKAWNAGWKAGRSYIFLLRRLSDNALIGSASLTNVRSWPSLNANLGYWLGQQYEGHGYMSEGVGALSAWAFDVLNMHRIEAGILASNLRSRRVLESNGFEEEGFAREYLEIAGVRRDHVLFALVRPALQH